jgi:hypothetical protein
VAGGRASSAAVGPGLDAQLPVAATAQGNCGQIEQVKNLEFYSYDKNNKNKFRISDKFDI